MMLSPLVLFTYNRFSHLQQTIHSLLQNPQAADSDLYIFSDAAKTESDVPKVKEVRNFLHQIRGFKNIDIEERKENYGLAKNVITGVTAILKTHHKVIVLEDDLIVSTQFLKYMNEALNLYQDELDIFSITGFNIPIQIPDRYQKDVYLSLRPASWSWATWEDRWLQADWEIRDFEKMIQERSLREGFNQGGEDLYPMLLKQYRGTINSWAIRWAYTHFMKKKYCVYPTRSMVQNIGNDGSGTHVSKLEQNKYHVNLYQGEFKLSKDLSTDPEILKRFRDFYKLSLYRKLRNWLFLR